MVIYSSLIATIITIICAFGILMTIYEMSEGFCFPNYFYDEGYNWIGSWLLCVLKSIICLPFYVVFNIFRYVYKFVYWLLTVGRKENDYENE